MLGFNKTTRAIFAAASVMLMFFILTSCRQEEGSIEKAEDVENEDTLYLFDYKDIILETTSSIGTEIKNCNIYLDIFGDLIILGELENTSRTTKTDIEMTIDIMGSGDSIVHSAKIPVKTDYLRRGARYPFNYCYNDKEKYIEISKVKIGVNYRVYNDDLGGNPIAKIEEYSYQGDNLIIKGSVANIGGEKIKDLKLLCTFYDNRDKVVFIKECYLSRERMMPGEVQDFALKVLLDSYLKEFTRFHFEIFFKDEIKVNV